MLEDTTQFFKSLADETRLAAVLLVHEHGELCVCELVEALKLSQPKISRHLSQLRTLGVLSDVRRGQWVYYRLSDALAPWAKEVLTHTAAANRQALQAMTRNLQAMENRPGVCG